MLCHDLFKSFDNRQEIDLVFIDFQKAFDKVSHSKLITRLSDFRINSNVLSVIKSFLTDRKQQVIIQGSLSEYVEVTSGVPQGSCLGPLLFKIFIESLVPNLTCSRGLFADDIVLYKTISCHSDQFELQKDLNTVHDWCIANQMYLNTEKCYSMTISRLRNSNQQREYSLAGINLKVTNSYKYLGVFLNSKLNWHQQVDSVVLKANQRLGFVRRNLGNCNKETKLKCYVALIRPILEYASSAWDPFLVSHIDAIEKVQRRSARFICNKFGRYDSVSSMLDELNLLPLHQRRKTARLCLFFKIDSKLTPLKPPSCVLRKEINRRTDNGKAYVHLPSHSNLYYSSYYVRTIRDWNTLKSNFVLSSSLGSFISKLKGGSGTQILIPGLNSIEE
jgi:ribonuclease P/MRP protein subunit RPP40